MKYCNLMFDSFIPASQQASSIERTVTTKSTATSGKREIDAI